MSILSLFCILHPLWTTDPAGRNDQRIAVGLWEAEPAPLLQLHGSGGFLFVYLMSRFCRGSLNKNVSLLKVTVLI